MLRDDPRAATATPGYFFIRFKWYLKTKYRKEVTRINRMWDYLNESRGSSPRLRVGYVQNELIKEGIDYENKQNKPHRRKRKRRSKRS